MKKIIKLNETDLVRIVKRVLNEKESPSAPEMPETPPAEYLDLVASDDTEKEDDDNMTQQVAEDRYKRRMNRRRLNEDGWDVINKLKACYKVSNVIFPGSCEKGTHSVCKEKIRKTVEEIFVKNNNNFEKANTFSACINKIDNTILQGLG